MASEVEKKIQQAYKADVKLQEMKKQLAELEKDAQAPDAWEDGEYFDAQINRLQEAIYAKENAIEAMVRYENSNDENAIPEDFYDDFNPYSGSYEY